MRRLRDLWYRIRVLAFRQRMEEDMADEFAFHVEMEARKYREQGMSSDEAIRAAKLKFGGEERFKEHARASWGVTPITDLGSDLRFASRQLTKNTAFSAVAVLTLALGIGGTVALFSVVHSLMIRPLPIDDENRVVVFWMDYNWRGEEFDLVKDVPRRFESIGAFSNDAYTLRTDAGSSLVLGTVASVEMWDVLGTPPLLGRTFQSGEDRAGSEPVVVLGHGIWEREFGGDRTIVGSRINLSGVQTTVVGVMPEHFYFPTPEMEIFVPLDLDPANRDYANNGWLVLAGRLRPAATQIQIDDDLRAIAGVLGERYNYSAIWDKTRNPYVLPVRDYLLGDTRPALLLLLSGVGILLLMACVNVTALMLIKTADRQREISVRVALGAGASRLARQLLTESLLLGFVSGMVGLGLAVGLFDVTVASLPIEPALRETLELGSVAFFVTLALAITTGGLIGCVPIRNVLRGEVSGGTLTSRTETASTHRAGRMQKALVVSEVLLAVVLVTGASLLVRTVDRLRAIDPGFDTQDVVTMEFFVSEDESADAERASFFRQLVDRAEALPGVSAAGLINRLPLRDGGYQGSVTIEGRPDLEGANRPNAMYRPVTPHVFKALGAEILQGRGIEGTDVAEGPLVAVVNETFARRIWGTENPIGRTYQTSFVGTVEIVGVVRDLAVTDLVGEQPMVGYYAWDQSLEGATFGTLLMKTSPGTAQPVEQLLAMVRDLEPRAVVGRVGTMEEALDAEIVEALRLRFFLGLFSLLGILLGAVGVYGVVLYSVQRRRAEFGIRLALGAKPTSLLGTVVSQGMLPVTLGIAGGTLAALFVSRLLEGFLYGVQPTDARSSATAAVALMLAGVAAALLPALKASTTDPAIALRAE